jgi:hypothetical protein
MELDQIKKNIADIFLKENVKHVFYVDDQVNAFENKKIMIIAHLRAKETIKGDPELEGLLSSNKIDLAEEDDIIINSIEQRLIPKNSVFALSLAKLLGVVSANGTDDEDNNALDIDKYFNRSSYSALEPGNAVATIVNKVNSLPAEERVLVLFDLELDLSDDAAAQFDGVDLLMQLKRQDARNQCICSIFTHLAKSVNDEIEKRKEIIANRIDDIDKSKLFVLAKKRKNNSLKFGDGIKKVILNPLYETVKDSSIKLLQEAFEVSCDELSDIDTYEFDHMILHASNLEGVWAGETLIRILNVIFDKNIKRKFIDSGYPSLVNPFFEKAIKLARHSFPLDPSDTPELNRNKIRNLELYTEADLVNQLYEPVVNGDIFEIDCGELKQKFILVGQECDIILRSDGRRNRKNDFFTLLRIDFKTKAEIITDIEKFTASFGFKNHFFSNKFILNNFDSSDPDLVGIIDFRNELVVYASILDLTSLNLDGEAKFDILGQYPLSSYCQSLRNRHKFIKGICANKLDSIQIIEAEFQAAGVQNIDKLIQRFIETLSPTNKLVGNLSPYNSGKFDFGIRRVQRLKTYWATKLLERYGYYLSRSAELPDYTELISPKDLKLN